MITKKNNLVFYFEFAEIIDFKAGKLYDIDAKMHEQYSNRTNNEVLQLENYDKVILLLDSFDDIKNEELKCSVLKSIDDYLSSSSIKICAKHERVVSSKNGLPTSS